MMNMKRMYSIRKEGDFKKILRYGKNLDFGIFKVYILKNSLSYSRFAYVVSQKVSKKATVRNKIRRRAKEFTRKFFDSSKRLDIIFVFKKGANDTTKREFYAKFTKAVNFLNYF